MTVNVPNRISLCGLDLVNTPSLVVEWTTERGWPVGAVDVPRRGVLSMKWLCHSYAPGLRHLKCPRVELHAV